MPPTHVFADETKEKGFVVTTGALSARDLATARRTMRGLIMPRQRRIHFTKESDARRKEVLDAIDQLGPEITIYDASTLPRRRQREACLSAIVADLADAGAQLLVLETDDSVLERDKRLLYQRVRELGCADRLQYHHLRAHQEPLLMIPDAVSWCWHRGGHWRVRIEAMNPTVRRVTNPG